MRRGMRWAVFTLVAVVAGACSGGTSEQAAGEKATDQKVVAGGEIAAPEELAELTLSPLLDVVPEGGMNPTTAYDPKSGAVYLAWAETIPGVPQPVAGHDQEVRAVVVRSDDGGKTFSAPVVASAPEDHVRTYTISPTQVVVGPGGEV
ncbi:MAG: sialidase family protein, partial [Acidimicrobiia bacterium]